MCAAVASKGRLGKFSGIEKRGHTWGEGNSRGSSNVGKAGSGQNVNVLSLWLASYLGRVMVQAPHGTHLSEPPASFVGPGEKRRVHSAGPDDTTFRAGTYFPYIRTP